jgi:tight adherence protein C
MWSTETVPSALTLATSGVFVAVALVVGATLSWWLARTSFEQKRLARMAEAGGAGLVVENRPLTDGPDPALARLSRLLPRSPKDMSRLQRRLARAGFIQRGAAFYFACLELLLPVVFAGAVLLLGRGGVSWLVALFAAVVGYALPGFYVDGKRRQRQKAIQNGLPDALDLLTVCVEAGSGLDQAISKASDELEIAHPELAHELKLVTTEVRAGKPRLDAFKNFAQRTGVEDVRSLVAMLTQTDRFGTSISQALRTHSETSRTKRRQRAEERAGKVGVKLVFPLALCLFPALYIVCFGPAAIRIYRAFLA